MKLFYLSSINDFEREKCGILKKIKGQINSFEHIGFEVHFGHFHGSNTFIIEHNDEEVELRVKGNTTRGRLSSIYDDVYRHIIKNGIKNIYIRFTPLDRNSIKFYQKLHDCGIKVIIEFYSHNLELEAEKTIRRRIHNKQFFNALKDSVSLLLNKLYFSKLHTCVDLIVTTTKVDKMYGINTINVTNGIDSKTIPIKTKEKNWYDINIISVAMNSPWHGYDRIIKGISNYYKNGGKSNILYNIVGDGEEKQNLEKLVEELSLSEHVCFTGIMIGDELEPYYNQADVALEMLAGFRRTDGQISSIKMAEYFAKGIPVVYAADHRQYNDSIENYCLRFENNDNAIDIGEIKYFLEDLHSKDDNIEEHMHDLAEKYFDWNSTMKNLHDFLLKK